MRAATIVLLVAFLGLAAANFVINEDIVSEVNSKNAGWTAGMNKRFAGVTKDEAKKLLGSKLLPHGTKLRDFPVVDKKLVGLPDSFDARTQWPGSVHDIRDQQQCGSCWAFGATEALSDRFNIFSNNTVNVVLSPQDLVSCDGDNYGCDGGYPILAWQYMQSLGVVTDDCYPYASGNGTTGDCLITGKVCPAGGSATFYKAASAYQVAADADSIRAEIYANGPVEAAFIVYDDFFSYTSGVYTHVSGDVAGGHAIKLLGWGTDASGTPYWIAANSWGTSWGMNGYFLIKRGTDECYIEDGVVAGLPSL